jgi:hypothetical protein
MDLPDYRIRAERDAALWYCLCHHSQQTEPADRQKETTNDKERAGEPQSATVVQPTETMPEAITANEERQYRRRYLVTHWGLVFVAVGGIVIAVCSLHALNHSIAVANKQLVMSERAWITAVVYVRSKRFSKLRR